VRDPIDLLRAGDIDAAMSAAAQAGDSALARKIGTFGAAWEASQAKLASGDRAGALRKLKAAAGLERELTGGRGPLADKLRAEGVLIVKEIRRKGPGTPPHGKPH